MATAVRITGDRKLDRTLRHMRTTAARRAVNLGTKKTAMAASKDVKAAIPSNNKGARKAIGWRSLKKREAPGGGAKIGASVGRGGKAKATDRSGRRGVGIHARNIHWWYLGTQARRTKSGKSTGRMPAHEEDVGVVVRRNAGKSRQILRRWVWTGIKKEVQKGKAF